MVDAKDPGAGDPWTLRAAGWERQFKAASVTAMSTRVVAAASAASGAAWTGQAQVAFQTSIDDVTPDLTELADSLAATGEALVVYADGVARIKDKQETLESRRARLRDEYDDLRAQVRQAEAEADSPYITFAAPAVRAEALGDELDVVGRGLDDIDEDWQALVREREALDAAFIDALTTRAVRGALYEFVQDAGLTAADILLALSALSAADMQALAAAHPELLERLLRSSTPEQAAAWWAELPAGQQNALVTNLPGLVGALGGLPALARVAANKVLAAERLKSLRAALRRTQERGVGDYDANQPYAAESAAADYLETLRALKSEMGFLERVVSGEAQLYLYDREGGRVIEMFGDPDTATVLMTFMPGTNTSMESFYSATATEGITALTRWQVENPEDGTQVAGFVVKQGDFPNLDDLWSEGPQHNWYASVLGPRYARLTHELNIITDGAPVVSVEHSFGSAVAGKAEIAGAQFASRYVLAGIGMTSDWSVQDGTEYYAAQGPGDVNRYFDDMENGGLGYAITPGEIPGVIERGTGFTGGDWAPWVLPIAPPVGTAALVTTALDQHNRIISGDLTENRDVLEDIRYVLAQTGKNQ